MSNIVFVLVLAAIIALAIVGMRMRKEQSNRAKVLGATSFGYGAVLHGVPHPPATSHLHLFVLDEKLVMEEKGIALELPFERVQSAVALSKTDLLTKDKSVLARGVVGGVLLGPLGAIIGGMTGIGKKKIKGSFLVVNYTPSGSENTEVLIMNFPNMQIAKKLADDITKKLISRKSENGIIEL